METTGITELRSDSHIKFYPNPATSQFTIQADDKIRKVTLLDQAGRALINLPVVDMPQVTITTSGLPDGIYYLSVTTDSASMQSSILKR